MSEILLDDHGRELHLGSVHYIDYLVSIGYPRPVLSDGKIVGYEGELSRYELPSSSVAR